MSQTTEYKEVDVTWSEDVGPPVPGIMFVFKKMVFQGWWIFFVPVVAEVPVPRI